MIQLLRRYRDLVVVAAALLLPLIVWSAHARHPGERSAVDRAVVRLSRPVEQLVAWAVGGTLDGWYAYLALRGAHQRAEELTSLVNRLSVDHMELARVRAENERLGRLLGFAPLAGDRPMVGARVIGVRLDPKGAQLLSIDRGSADGLQRMMPVVAAQGVVGRVHSVLAHSAEVLLVTDRNSSVAVSSERSRARANVRGTGEPWICRLDYALRSDDFLEGDLLVTSGTDGVFPRGLPVGRVQGLRRAGLGLYQRAEVLPAADVTRVEELLVLPPGREEAAATRLPQP